jgi:uncharacterized protein YvpB
MVIGFLEVVMSNTNHIRNLPVPYFSQRENTSVWKEREPLFITKTVNNKKTDIPNTNAGKEKAGGKKDAMSLCSCNVTCLAMILNYCGITVDTPDTIMNKIFSEVKINDNDDLIALKEENYTSGSTNVEIPDNLKKIVKALYNVDTVTVSYSANLAFLQSTVASGFPVMVSCGMLRKNEESFYQNIIDGVNDDALYSYNHEGIKNIRDDLNSRYKRKFTTDYTDDLKNIEKEKAVAETTEEKKTVAEKIEKIEKQYEEIKKEVLDYCLEDYRNHGHFIVVRGFTENSVIINDPWGDPTDFYGKFPKDGKGNYYNSSPYGDNITISIDDFNKQYNQNKKTFWSTLVVRHNRWNFVFNGIIPRGTKPTIEQLNKCFDFETFEYGGFPMKRSNLWHNGIHLKAKDTRPVFPIGPGQIVAARIIDDDLNNPKTNPPPANGNRCFVLVKHQINVEDEIKDFYSLYMHLKPENDPKTIIEKYPEKSFEADWLNELAFRAQKVIKVLDSVTPQVYRANDNKKIALLSKGKIFVYNEIKKVDDKNRVYYYYKNESDYQVECYSFLSDGFYVYPCAEKENSGFIMDAYTEVLNSLSEGKTTYFTELPDPVIEVSAATIIGKTGKYGGYDTKKKGMIHFEIFSDEVIIPDGKKSYNFIPLSETPSAMCDRKKMIELFDHFGLYDTLAEGVQFAHLEDGLISKPEMIQYYMQKPEILQKTICQHTNEWFEEIDWKKEFENSVGVPRSFPFIPDGVLRDKLKDNLEEYVKNIFEPYKWMNEECLNAMNPITRTNLAKGSATYYHPIEFLKWLVKYENNNT